MEDTRTQIELLEMKATLSYMKIHWMGLTPEQRVQKKLSKLQDGNQKYPKENAQKKKELKN